MDFAKPLPFAGARWDLAAIAHCDRVHPEKGYSI
jgi:hypothetical protein